MDRRLRARKLLEAAGPDLSDEVDGMDDIQDILRALSKKSKWHHPGTPYQSGNEFDDGGEWTIKRVKDITATNEVVFDIVGKKFFSFDVPQDDVTDSQALHHIERTMFTDGPEGGDGGWGVSYEVEARAALGRTADETAKNILFQFDRETDDIAADWYDTQAKVNKLAADINRANEELAPPDEER